MPSHSDSSDTCVQEALNGLLALEHALVDNSCDMEAAATAHAAATAFIADVRQTAANHVQALAARMSALGHATPEVRRNERAPATRTAAECRITVGPISGALQETAALVFQAAMSYATALHLAIRHRDSWIAVPEGSTAHLCRAYLQEYQMLLGNLPLLLGDVVLADLEARGESCKCTCPACSMGLCMCGQPVVWREAQLAAHSQLSTTPIAIPAPRPGSAAAAADLQHGDQVLEIEGVGIDSLATLMTSIKAAAPGSHVRLTVRRGQRTFPVSTARPSAEVSPGTPAADATDCLQPSGSNFYLDRARDLQRHLRRGGAPIAPHPDGMTALTSRELQVLRLVADGATNSMIGEKLHIAKPTVARHIANILQKLGAANRAEAAGVAASAGLRADA